MRYKACEIKKILEKNWFTDPEILDSVSSTYEGENITDIGELLDAAFEEEQARSKYDFSKRA